MKNLLVVLTLITLTFLSCSKKDDDTSPPPDTTIYEGTWRGTYTGDADGKWINIVSGEGTLTGTWVKADSVAWGTTSGFVKENGEVVLYFSSASGGSGTAQLNADTGVYTGTWQNNSQVNPESGTSTGTKD
jgi:hypothetical protein